MSKDLIERLNQATMRNPLSNLHSQLALSFATKTFKQTS